MSSATPHRIDPSNLARPHLGGPRSEASRRPAVAVNRKDAKSVDTSASPADNKTPSAVVDRDDEAATIQRIDPSVDGPPRRASFFPGRQEPASPHGAIGPSPENDDLSEPAWLELHAAELVSKLQHWGSELDDREAQLNARAAVQDQRERHFRMQQQDVAADMAEQQRLIQRKQDEIESQARRLAFADPSESSG